MLHVPRVVYNILCVICLQASDDILLQRHVVLKIYVFVSVTFFFVSSLTVITG